jgi:Outer membrane protein beta-barrel family
LYLLRNFELTTNATYTWQQKTSQFPASTSVLLWNAGLNRNFLQNRLVVRFQTNNLLNRNAGIIRTNNANINTESSTNILGRYWLVSIAYYFDKKFGKKSH